MVNSNSFTDIGIYALKLLSEAILFLKLDVIRRDGGTEPRAAIDLEHVKWLGSQINDGQALEPVIVFYDGESYWLADGFHRFAAYRHQGKEAIACIVHQGTLRDAILYSVGANVENKPALPRLDRDKHRAVKTLLQDPEWSKWSDSTIARTCKVDLATVTRIRNQLREKIPSGEKRLGKLRQPTKRDRFSVEPSTRSSNNCNISETQLPPPDPSYFLDAIHEYNTVVREYYKDLHFCIPNPRRFLAAVRDYHIAVSEYYKNLAFFH